MSNRFHLNELFIHEIVAWTRLPPQSTRTALTDAARVLANVAKRGLLKQGLRCPAQNTPIPSNNVGVAKVKLSAGTALSTDRLTYLA